MYPLCRHIKTDGVPCGSPALKDTLFCWHHARIRKLRRNRRRNANDFTPLIPFDYPEDHAAIQHNHFLVMQAFNEGKIDRRDAATYTSMLRACRLNLGKPLAESGHETSARNPTQNAVKNTVQRVILTPEGDEIAPPREALEDGEAAPLHHKACPCQQCAEQYRNAAPEQHHPDCKCGLCEETSTGESESTGEREKGKGKSETSDSAALSPLPSTLSPLSPLSPAPRIAPARKLYAQQRTTDPANKELDVYTYLYGDHLKKYEAQYAARARAAIEAGIEPPPYEPFSTSKIELECLKQEKIRNEQIEKNKQIAEQAWQRYVAREAAAGRTVEDKPLPPTWHEQEAIRREQWKKLRENQQQQEPLTASS